MRESRQKEKDNRPTDGLLHPVIRQSGFFSYHLADFIGQLFDHHTKTPQFLEHADQVLTGKATNHLQVFNRKKRIPQNISESNWEIYSDHSFRHLTGRRSSQLHARMTCEQLRLPLVLCPVNSVLMAEEPLRFSRTIVSLVIAEKGISAVAVK